MNLRTMSLIVSVATTAAPAVAATCESLAGLRLPDTTITRAELVAAGKLSLPDMAPSVAKGLPRFCRVAATLAPTADSDIKIEVWMPMSAWNRKYLAIGNSGWAGAISFGGMGQALRRGYATSSTDTGYVGDSGDASFALGHPEKVIDFGYRAAHEMTMKAKAIIAAFYGAGPQYAYWNGCATGGKQGLTAAQRFPNDFHGIIAGAPDNVILTAIDPNLERFFDRGGKLLQYHGWNDLRISPLNSIDYYQSVLAAARHGRNVNDSHRLFMVPGMGHCSGGEGPNTFDAIGALERWVEKGKAPDEIVATHATKGVIDRTRPLCPYPQTAQFVEPDRAAAGRDPLGRSQRHRALPAVHAGIVRRLRLEKLAGRGDFRVSMTPESRPCLDAQSSSTPFLRE